jgi:hypothetical protein
MELSKIEASWPNALRWFLVQNLQSFTPWHFIDEPLEFEFAAKAFRREDVSNGEVFVFASRQDNDDFAGIEIIDGKLTDKVLYFHPVFGTSTSDRSWNIVNEVFEDVFEFVAKRVISDMKDWALVEDANDL